MRRRRSAGADWVRAKWALQQLIGGGTHAEIGWVRSLGGGLYRRVFGADVEAVPGSALPTGSYVVLVPRDEPDADAATPEREAALLKRLEELGLPLRFPHVAGVVSDDGQSLLVETFVPGVPLDGVPPLALVRPWEVTATVAAIVHSVGVDAVANAVEGFRTRREHAEAQVAVFDRIPCDDPLVRDARSWAREHLPPPSPAVLVHGDLLGQNILLSPTDLPFGVIDWQLATTGDPAYDLAIVTRGKKRPFRVPEGFRLLLDAYAAAGGADVSPAAVRLHEVCMATAWYADSLDPATRREPPENALGFLQGVFRRAVAQG